MNRRKPHKFSRIVLSALYNMCMLLHTNAVKLQQNHTNCNILPVKRNAPQHLCAAGLTDLFRLEDLLKLTQEERLLASCARADAQPVREAADRNAALRKLLKKLLRICGFHEDKVRARRIHILN